MIVHMDMMQFLCTWMPFPVPDQEVENLLSYNMLSPDMEKELGGHQVFLVIAGNEFDLGEKREACFRFNRLCGAVMGLESAAGMYMGGAGLLIPKDVYAKHVEIVKSPTGRDQNYFPAPLWIRVLLYLDGDKKMAKTSGLNDFGYPDVCFFNTHLEQELLYQLSCMIAIEEITGRNVYQSGDLIEMGYGDEAICKQSGDVLSIIGT